MTCKLVFSYFDKDHTMTIPVKFWQHLQSGGGGVVSTNCWWQTKDRTLLLTIANLKLSCLCVLRSAKLVFTIRYCSSSIVNCTFFDEFVRAYLSNSEVFSPSSLASRHMIIGFSCRWSPISTTCFAYVAIMGTRHCGSGHIPASSTITCNINNNNKIYYIFESQWLWLFSLVKLSSTQFDHTKRQIA